jgi:NTE family protein
VKRQLAFVLGGGGARGALQVGALRALLEAGIKPDILVGTSIGAANASFLATKGVNLKSLETLAKAWKMAMTEEMLPSNYLWLTIRILFNRAGTETVHRMRDFLIEHGLDENLTFGDIRDVKLVMIAADLNQHCPIIFGLNPNDNLVEAVLASTTLPPWVSPVERENMLLMDGGIVSTLSIETALKMGASEIVALDITDPRVLTQEGSGFGLFLGKLIHTIEQRQIELELALAKAKRVPVLHLHLLGKQPVPVWEFQHAEELIETGFEIANREIIQWNAKRRPWWQLWKTSGRGDKTKPKLVQNGIDVAAHDLTERATAQPGESENHRSVE